MARCAATYPAARHNRLSSQPSLVTTIYGSSTPVADGVGADWLAPDVAADVLESTVVAALARPPKPDKVMARASTVP